MTGSSGYIGSHVVKELISQGQKVILNDFSHNNVDKRVLISEANIFSVKNNLYKSLNFPDIIIHLVWKDGFVHNSDSHMLNLSKHYEFLTNMVKSGCKNIAAMGTMHEAGHWEGAIDENYTL